MYVAKRTKLTPKGSQANSSRSRPTGFLSSPSSSQNDQDDQGEDLIDEENLEKSNELLEKYQTLILELQDRVRKNIDWDTSETNNFVLENVHSIYPDA